MPKKGTKTLFYLVPMGEGIAHLYCQESKAKTMMRSNNEKYTDDKLKGFLEHNSKVSELHCVQCNKLLWKKWPKLDRVKFVVEKSNQIDISYIIVLYYGEDTVRPLKWRGQDSWGI